jgi:hypothetical protein
LRGALDEERPATSEIERSKRATICQTVLAWRRSWTQGSAFMGEARRRVAGGPSKLAVAAARIVGRPREGEGWQALS